MPLPSGLAAGISARGVPPFSLREKVPAKPADEGAFACVTLIRLAALASIHLLPEGEGTAPRKTLYPT